MTESEIMLKKKKQARGFAGLLGAIMEPLNENPEFKEQCKDTNRTYLIDAPNLNYAALIKVKEGTISVESVPNKPVDNLKKSKLGWDGMASMDSQLFLLLAANRLSLLKLVLKVLTGKVKVGGITKLLGLLKIMKILQG